MRPSESFSDPAKTFCHAFGKSEYKEIAKLRDELEEALLSELPELHKIDKFLAGKTVEKKISETDLKRRPSGDES